MSRAIRTHGPKAFTKQIIEIVRGKAAAYAREAVLINERRPALNTKMRSA